MSVSTSSFFLSLVNGDATAVPLDIGGNYKLYIRRRVNLKKTRQLRRVDVDCVAVVCVRKPGPNYHDFVFYF